MQRPTAESLSRGLPQDFAMNPAKCLVSPDLTWRLAFDWGGANEIHNVKWDGTYLGNQ